MENVKMSLKGRKLNITVDLDHRAGLSASRKTVIVASTQGNVRVPGAEGIRLGLNCYTTAPCEPSLDEQLRDAKARVHELEERLHQAAAVLKG